MALSALTIKSRIFFSFSETEVLEGVAAPFSEGVTTVLVMDAVCLVSSGYSFKNYSVRIPSYVFW